MSAVVLLSARGKLELPQTVVQRWRKKLVCCSGVLVIQFDGDRFHFCILSQSVFTSVEAEEGQFTVSVQGSGKTLLTPELSGAQFERWGLLCLDGVGAVGTLMSLVSVGS